jgi:FkbM family methyltransferase
MVFNVRDTHVGRSLDLYGEWVESELDLLGPWLAPGDVVIDAGANVGNHTVFFAGRVGPDGRVYAFEPQRRVFQMLCANLALNGVTNVEAVQAAVGTGLGEVAIPDVDYTAPGNFGGVRLACGAGRQVPVRSLDSLGLARCAAIKIDVEGMELDVIDGASDLIARTRPLLYVENNDRAKSGALIRRIAGFGYQLFWHFSRYYNPNNFFAERQNAFGGLADANMICVHQDRARRLPDTLAPVAGPDDHAEAALRRRELAERGAP